MPLPSLLAGPAEVLRTQAGDLFDRARAEAMDRVAQLAGRGADRIDGAGQALADETVSAAEQLTTAADRVAGQVAGTIGRWSTALGDRMVRLGEDLAHRDRGHE